MDDSDRWLGYRRDSDMCAGSLGMPTPEQRVRAGLRVRRRPPKAPGSAGQSRGRAARPELPDPGEREREKERDRERERERERERGRERERERERLGCRARSRGRRLTLAALVRAPL